MTHRAYCTKCEMWVTLENVRPWPGIPGFATGECKHCHGTMAPQEEYSDRLTLTGLFVLFTIFLGVVAVLTQVWKTFGGSA